ncbi:ABC transporter ATP-binding protein [Neoroseomonas oryzicola]|uniref:ABC transporter ATP-binding protein n=1 Tax=Neoroseomonas oryzicola TaxID=535904 RepID=A0A9X9WF61_9PROT|nr:oligopeptide/dipeptide ABC transporter ATP-binding protein [Neoroseomonas oryzicola]MBR0658971.1 ABC transporter ATP-binding protein [Neoroseomonas oryzicola]NKE19705.1 ABC transporter ATP-binding protein [Neoroseomonas oryzicola]
MTQPLLRAEGLSKTYEGKRGLFRATRAVQAVAELDLALDHGAALGIVGESGCGKSTLARLLLRLIPLSAGRITFDEQDITALDEAAMRPLRRRMQLIHQNPSAALDPRLTAEDAVAEPLRIQGLATGRALRDRVAALLTEVGLPPAFLHRFPHELSGGQKQRVCIARALALEPDLLVLDEPTSALDVSVQAQILDVLDALRARRGLAYLFISHNLAVVRQVCERVAVMYLGRIVEEGTAAEVLGAPRHPYTRALLGSVPRLAAHGVAPAAPGEPPNPASPPPGCAFQPRCPIAVPACRESMPPLATLMDGHRLRCPRAMEVSP